MKFYLCHKFLDGAETGYFSVTEWLSKFGGAFSIPEDNEVQCQNVCFVNARIVPAGENVPPPQAEDYIAAPMVGEVGAGPGYIPQEEIKSWFLVYKHQDAVRYRRNLTIPPESTCC